MSTPHSRWTTAAGSRRMALDISAKIKVERRNEIQCSNACDSTPKANGRLQQGGPGQTETDVSANPSAEWLMRPSGQRG